MRGEGLAALDGLAGADGLGGRGEFEGVGADESEEVAAGLLSPLRLLGSLCGFMARRSRGRPLRRDPCG